MMAQQARNQHKRKAQEPRLSKPLLLSGLAFLLVLLAGLQVQQWLSSPTTLPMKLVRIEGELKYLKLKDLENAVAGKVSGGFFSIDLQAVQNAARQLPWLQQISVKRVWPNTLVLVVEERVAVARWGDKQLVTANGEVFDSQDTGPADLPLLDGPIELAPLLVQRMRSETQRFADLGLQLQQMNVNARGSWQIEFRNGLQVALGQEDVMLKLNRLARHIKRLDRMKGMPQRIDLRYRHGMAVKWPEAVDQQPESAGQTKHRGKV
ncbi:MAG: cell division protein FtsQ/DivIB [Chromatiales bacterium]|jgi:cell division protein FtsQ